MSPELEMAHSQWLQQFEDMRAAISKLEPLDQTRTLPAYGDSLFAEDEVVPSFDDHTIWDLIWDEDGQTTSSDEDLAGSP